MSNDNANYFRTWNEGVKRTHLRGISDMTLCGFDTSGDDLIHDRPPEALPDGKHRITCEHCLTLMEIVDEHRKRK